jgi:hypothetical protein
MKQNETNLAKKMPESFQCILCDFKCFKQSNFNLHLLTRKHKMKQNETLLHGENTYNVLNHSQCHDFQCHNCLEKFNSRTTLWRHKKKCQDQTSNPTTKDQTELVQYLMKENSEFKQLMIEQNKQMIELAKNSGHHNNFNSHNKTFNLQVFLNETCKNAININEFIDQLPVSISDLEETGKVGFTEGISKIFIDGLKSIEVPDRPLHCSDLKRETIYIKNNNEWTKDTDENSLLVNAIKKVSNKNIKQIIEWQKINPEYKDSSSKINDKYLQIVSESMPGFTKEECDKNYKKIKKNIAKEIIIDKNLT